MRQAPRDRSTPLRAAPPPGPPAPPVSVTLLQGCAVLETSSLWVLFDAGPASDGWIAGRKAPEDSWLLLSRYPEDPSHMAAAGARLLGAGSRMRLSGPEDPEGTLQCLAPLVSALLPSGRQTQPLLHPQREGEFTLAPGILGQALHVRNPGATLAYRVHAHGRSVVYCPRNEIDSDPGGRKGHEAGKLRAFLRKADLLVYDAGAAWQTPVDLAADSEVRLLALLPDGGTRREGALQAAIDGRLSSRGGRTSCVPAEAGRSFAL